MDFSTARSLMISAITSNGLTITDADADAAAHEMSGSIAFDAASNSYIPVNPDGSRTLKVTDGRAVDLDLSEYVLGLARRFGKWSKPAAPAPRPDGMTKTATARERLAGLRTAHLDAAVAEIAVGPNPWAKATSNRTKQALVSKHNPTLAAELRRKAGQ